MSPGRTTGASAEDISMAPDVAKTMSYGEEIDVLDDGGTYSSEIQLPAGDVDPYRYQGNKCTYLGWRCRWQGAPDLSKGLARIS